MSGNGITWKSLLAGDNRKPALVLLLAPLLLTTFKYYGTTAFYLSRWAGTPGFAGNPSRSAECYHFLAALVLLGLIPALVVTFVFKERLSSYGVQRGDVRTSLKAILILLPVMLLATWPSAARPEFAAEYPFDKGAGSSAGAFLIHSGAYLLYYAGWEFFFRGFMQFGLRERLGDWNAILVQTLASCLVHIGKPAGEIYGSILAGLVWGFVVCRTGALWPVLLVHWALGVSLDFFLCFCGKGL